jgi:flavin-dependent dehydrogenase
VAALRSDVLVIGGGPAGTAAAITCAQAGLSVSLVEGRAFPRHRPGETLHPGIEPLLDRLGAAEAVRRAGFLRHPGVWVKQDGCDRFERYGEDANGPWLGFQAPRAEFDALLLAAARAQGVRIYQPHRALSCVVERGRVCGAETTSGVIHAAFTVDASGDGAWLAGQLALPVNRASSRFIARYGYMRGECPGRDSAPRFEYLPGGWVWTARVRPGLYHWTRLVSPGAGVARDWRPSEFADLEPAAAVRGADVSWRIVDRCAGPGYFVAGDAAAVTDPSSSKGVLHAMMSGMLAGHWVARCVLSRSLEREGSEQYSRFLHSWFRHSAGRASEFFPELRVAAHLFERPHLLEHTQEYCAIQACDPGGSRY